MRTLNLVRQKPSLPARDGPGRTRSTPEQVRDLRYELHDVCPLSLDYGVARKHGKNSFLPAPLP